MRVLVTGHLGYLGAVLVPVLHAAGHEVVGVDAGWYAERALASLPSVDHTIRSDVRDLAEADVQGCEAVVHLAALSNDPLGALDPELTFDVNLRGTQHVARIAREVGAHRFVFASTCSTYGAADTDDLVDETAPLKPVTTYAETKVRAEEVLVDLADDDFCPVLLRNATAYGWSPALRTDLVVNDFVATAMLTGSIVVRSDGTPWRPLVHAEDIAGAALAALEAPAGTVRGEAINIGSAADNHQIGALAHDVAVVIPGARVEVTGETGADPRSYRVDFSKASRLLPHHSPKWTVGAGAAALYEVLRDTGCSAQALAACRRVPQLQSAMQVGRLGSDLRAR